MEYTIQKLALVSGTTKRTLHYYDEIDLLKPLRINSSGYRIYGASEVDRLQQIMFFREMDVNLNEIKRILDEPQFSETEALRSHLKSLIDKKNEIDKMIHNIKKTIDVKEGRNTMTDQEKFEGLKKEMLDKNEAEFGKEIREKYGSDAVEKSNRKFMAMSSEESDYVGKLAGDMIDLLVKAVEENAEPDSAIGKEISEKHKEWISFYWDQYSVEAHLGVVEMYVADDRFKAYYDRHKEGAAQFLRDAVVAYLK